eukprot:968033-Prorocentrum_minimum.AAC.2
MLGHSSRAISNLPVFGIPDTNPYLGEGRKLRITSPRALRLADTDTSPPVTSHHITEVRTRFAACPSPFRNVKPVFSQAMRD